MRHYRYAAILFAICMTVSTTGCIGDSSQTASDGTATTQTLENADMATIEATVKTLQEQWNKVDQESLMETSIQELLDAFDRVSATYSRAEMAYYAEWERPSLKKKYQQSYEDFYVASEMLSWVFCNAHDKSRYRDYFAPYVDDSDKAYYLTYSLSRVKANARSDSAEYRDNLNEYYDVANNSDLKLEETNRQCASLYLDNLKTYNTNHYLYDYYNRDYTAEQTTALYETILKELVPVANEMYEAIEKDKRFSKLKKADYVLENPFSVIASHCGTLSNSIQESAKKINEEQLYVLASGDACYDGCYTVALPSEQSALIYLYQAGDFYDFSAAVHEFGHFHSDWRDKTPVYCQKNSVDVAEVQSQGMQMLFTTCYDEIYGADADYLELVAVYDIVDSIVAGFSVGAFENKVMERVNSITPNEVLELFETYAEAGCVAHEFYEISHLFEQPGYYISYGVSALAALQIYATLQEDVAKGIAMYDRISATSAMSGENSTVAALNACGFQDLFASETLSNAVAVLRQYALPTT